MTIADWTARLAGHFSALHASRPDGRPVFALEHGLSADDQDHLARAVHDRVRSGALTTADRLPLVVYSAEMGYSFDGLEFWGSFADATPGWSMLWTVDRRRRWIRDAFHHFAKAFGGATPGGPWARKFSLIAWPITHAILPLDLQRHLVRVLGQRLQLQASDLTDPLRLGERIQAEAGGASRRFVAFAQQTAFAGQIALAILEDDDQAAAYLDPATVRRFVADIQRRRAESALLDAARESARIHLRGLRSGASPDADTAPRLPGDPTPRSLGLAVDLDVRPRQDGTWSVGLSLPGLHPLVAYRPAFREALETSYLTVNGSDDDLPPGTLLYGRRRVTLDRWPDPSKPLLDLESDDARLCGLLAELALTQADVWLFRVQTDGTTREVSGRHVRPGETYVVLRPSDEAIDLPGGISLRLACDGATATLAEIPEAPDAALRSTLRACGIEVASAIEVWPAGPPPASWDGAGTVEWLSGSPTVVGLATDAPVVELSLSLDGGPPWSLGALAPGRPAFVSLGALPVGTHHLDAEALVDDGADGAVAQGRLEIRVRDRSPWTASASEAAPLHVRVSPPQPDLDELWAGDVAVEAWGPPGAALRVRVDFLKTADAPAFASRPATGKPPDKLPLPLTVDAWRAYVARYLAADEAAGTLAEQASLVRIHLDGRELGSTVIDVERHQRALRWTVAGQHAQLLDDRGLDESDEAATAVVFRPARPLHPEPLVTDEALAGLTLPLGGLVVAQSAGDSVSSLVLPHVDRSQGLAALRVFEPECDLGTLRRTPADLQRLLAAAALWGNAQHAVTSLVGSSLRRHVLCCVAGHLAHVLAGPNWARDEDRARQGPRMRLDELAHSVPPKGERGAWQGRLGRLADADTTRSRVQAFDDLAIWLRWLPGTYVGTRLAADAAQRRALGPDHSAWTAEFALRLASAPHTLPAWAGPHLEAALELVLDETHLYRAARYAVVASASDAPTESLSLYPTWTWPSLD